MIWAFCLLICTEDRCLCCEPKIHKHMKTYCSVVVHIFKENSVYHQPLTNNHSLFYPCNMLFCPPGDRCITLEKKVKNFFTDSQIQFYSKQSLDTGRSFSFVQEGSPPYQSLWRFLFGFQSYTVDQRRKEQLKARCV